MTWGKRPTEPTAACAEAVQANIHPMAETLRGTSKPGFVVTEPSLRRLATACAFFLSSPRWRSSGPNTDCQTMSCAVTRMLE